MLRLNNNYLFLFLCQLLPVSSIFFFYKNRSLNVIELLSLNCYISIEYIKFFFIHLRLSFLFYSTQSIEMFAYSTIMINYNVLMYIYYNLNFHKYIKFYTIINFYLNNQLSIETLYFNFWWLEREVSEMNGIIFLYKYDTRNLLLEYFSIFKPLKKQFPSFGLTEIYYNLIYFFTIQPLISLQN